MLGENITNKANMRQQYFLVTMILAVQELAVPSSGFTAVVGTVHGPVLTTKRSATKENVGGRVEEKVGDRLEEKKSALRKRRSDLKSLLKMKPCKQWETETDPEKYWFNGKIHKLGNTGFGGAVHAAIGAASTKVIDNLAYEGRDVRRGVSEELKRRVMESRGDGTGGIKVLDMCCGVGMSTRAIKKAFDLVENATVVVGLDTSPEMIEMSKLLTVHEADMERARGRGLLNPDNIKYFAEKSARRLRRGKPFNRAIECADVAGLTFTTCNAEHTPFPQGSFDIVTIMYAFHETPKAGRDIIIQEAMRLLAPGGLFAVVDISRKYKPSKQMLRGEPYVLEYQENIQEQMANQPGFTDFWNEIIVPGQVELWLLTRE